MDLVSLYFRLLWYHSILRSSIDQKHAKTHDTKFEDKTVKSTQLSLVLVGLHDFHSFPDRTAHAWSVEVGNICSVSVFFVRVGSQISPRRAKKDSNIPSPGRTRSVKCPTPGPTTTIKSPPHALPPRPAGIILIGALKFSFFNVCENMQHQGRSLRMLAVGFRYERKQWGIQGRDPGARPPPWSLDQTEARRAEENFLWDRLPSPPHLISGSG